MLELSLRQSLAMSAGDYRIFFERPIAATMMGLSAILVLLAVRPLFFKGKDWRQEVGLEKQ
jgi:TctA family transporter